MKYGVHANECFTLFIMYILLHFLNNFKGIFKIFSVFFNIFSFFLKNIDSQLRFFIQSTPFFIQLNENNYDTHNYIVLRSNIIMRVIVRNKLQKI